MAEALKQKGLKKSGTMNRKRALDSTKISPSCSQPYASLQEEPCSKGGHSRNCQTNPACLYGMGEGKEGIWAKQPGIIANLERNREQLKQRATTDQAQHPVGLINLGATCYLNVLLQTLFSCLPFRTAIYYYPGTCTAGGSPLVLEIQRVFGRLDPLNITANCDLTDLVNLLGFDRGYQQDPFECWKLLGSSIDQAFQETGDPKLMAMFEEFRGRQKYITTCNTCGQQREREETIEELQVQIRGNHTVSEGFAQYVGVEELSGECQYYCETCEKLCDAERKVLITKLLQVLWVQLLRYEYNMSTFMKVKLTDCIDLEDTLAMDRFFSCDLPSSSYDLVSVIEHLGLEAHNGHYVARNRDWLQDSWWLLDDDKVSADSSTVEVEDSSEDEDPAPKKNKSKAKVKKPDLTTDSLQRLNRQPVRRSKDCYVMVYVAQSRLNEVTAPTPPPHICHEIALRNNKLSAAVECHETEIAELKTRIADRRRWYSDSYARLIPNAEDEVVLVEADWLKRWVTGVPKGESPTALFSELPPPCSSLLCEHSSEFEGHASPQQASRLKKVKLSALKDMLCQGGHPAEAVETACAALLSENVDSAWYVECAECGSAYKKQRTLDQARDELRGRVLSGVDEGNGPFLVSKLWFTTFKNDVPKKGKRGGSMSDFVVKERAEVDPTINTKVVCEHGLLAPNSSVRTMSRDGWEALMELFPAAITLEKQERCPDCVEHSRGVTGIRKEDKQKRMEHVSGELGKLYKRSKPLVLKDMMVETNQCGKFILVSSFFLQNWRRWVNGDHGDPDKPPVCERGSADELQCTCGYVTLPLNFDDHVIRLPLFDDSQEVRYELVKESQYRELAVRCNFDESLRQVCLEVGDGLQWSPKPCRECMDLVQAEWERESYGFTDSPLNIAVLSEGAPTPSQPTSRTARPRRSRRSGTASKVYGVSSSDLVGLLKMKIWQTVGDELEPHKIQLWVDTEQLEDDNATLASFGIHANSTVHVRPLSRPTHEMQNYFKFTGASFHHSDVAPEIGFKNTLLTGGIQEVVPRSPCEHCTYKLQPGEIPNGRTCLMCHQAISVLVD